MTSKSKDPTENIPPLSSAESIGGLAQPSAPLARTDNTPTSTQTSQKSLPPTFPVETPSVTTPRTTPAPTEKTRQHADIARVVLSQLEKAGLIKRFKVLSADLTTVQKIRIEFDASIWTEGLELK